MKILKLMNEKNENIGFYFTISFISYLFLILTNNISAIPSEFYSNITKFAIVTCFDFLLNFCLIFFTMSIHKFCVYIYFTIISIIGCVNYWTMAITNKRFSLSDIFLAKTAFANVAEISITPSEILYFLFLLILIFFLFRSVKKYKKKENTKNYRILMSIIMCIFSICIIYEFRTDEFMSYQIGNSTGLFSETSYIFTSFEYLKKPNNFKKNMEIIKEKETETLKSNREKAPVVIQIMSEALADFKNVDYMPFTRSIESGTAIPDIWGNKTVTSELESLTGISSNVLGIDGTRIYDSMLNENMDSTVSQLEANGYKTIGLHPYLPESYQREKKWETLGFDETYFMNDFDNPKHVRSYISDQSFFEKIEELVEKNNESPLYIFGVSMQNHAGFTNKDLKSEVNFGGEELNQYITLQNITDAAFKNFIEKMEKEDREVIVLYYGDHQPMLGEEDYNILNVDSKYAVPYVMWSNKRDLKTFDQISMSYLPALLLENSNNNMNGWFKNLDKLMNNNSVIDHNSLYKSWCYYQIKKRG